MVEVVNGGSNMNGEWCARLEGKVDLINDRHERFADDMKDVRERLHSHSNRIQELQNSNTLAQGKQEGASSVVKVLWAILAVMLTGGVLTVGMFAKFVMTI